MNTLIQKLNELNGDIRSYFDTIGVNVINEDDLYLFKYDQISVKWNDVSKICRGIICRKTDKWEVVSWPFNKFYNYDEGHCELFGKKELDENLLLSEKTDGTCIQLWFDDKKNVWRVSTLGTITTTFVSRTDSRTIEELFWTKFSKSKLSILNKSVCYIFELCTSVNKVKTSYTKDIIFLLGARNLLTGDLIERVNLVNLSYLLNVEYPTITSLKSLKIKSVSDLFKYVESAQPHHSSSLPEGYVLCVGATPIAKFKNSSYNSIHKLNDSVGSEKLLYTLAISDKIDDLMSLLSEEQKVKVNEYIKKISETKTKVDSMIKELVSITDQKAFALKISSDAILSPFSAFFFNNRHGIYSGRYINFLDHLREFNEKKQKPNYELYFDSFRKMKI